MSNRIYERFMSRHFKGMDNGALTRGNIQSVIDSGRYALLRVEDYQSRDVIRKFLLCWAIEMSNKGWGFPNINERCSVKEQEGRGGGSERKG